MNSNVLLIGPNESSDLVLQLLVSVGENRTISLSKFQNAFFMVQDGTLKELYNKETIFTDFKINSSGASSKGIQNEFLNRMRQGYMEIKDGDAGELTDKAAKAAKSYEELKFELGYDKFSGAKSVYFENRGEAMLEFLKKRMRSYMKMPDKTLHKMIQVYGDDYKESKKYL